MARKGSKKVKTGCRTCKIRKVKCDEARPACERCTSTGRVCDGYDYHPAASSSSGAVVAASSAASGPIAIRPRVVHAKLAPRTAVWPSGRSHLAASESRSLQYYIEVTAPQYSRVCDTFFWGKAVMVLGQNQPAVQHAAIAVGSIHEQFHNVGAAPVTRFAIRQFNEAIRHLVAKTDLSDDSDTGAVIVVCVLFSIIEFLLHNHADAMTHCRHSILMFNDMPSVSPWIRKNLLPFIRRAVTYPLVLYGRLDYRPLPALKDDFGGVLARCNATFTSLEEAQDVLHGLTTQAAHLIHSADPFRVGTHRGEPIPDALINEQRVTLANLDRWSSMFGIFRALPRGVSAFEEPAEHWFIDPVTEFEMRAVTARAWLAGQFDFDAGELAFDRHMASFLRINELARSLAARKYHQRSDGQPSHQLRFRFDVGILPPLYFVVRWCRDLAVRLEALWLLRRLCPSDDCLFDVHTLSAALCYALECEHAISLASIPWQASDDVHVLISDYRDVIAAMNPDVWEPPEVSVPPERRIWGEIIIPDAEKAPDDDANGRPRGERMVRYVKVIDNCVYRIDDVVPVATFPIGGSELLSPYAVHMLALRKSLTQADPLVHGPALWLSWGGF